MSADYTLAAIAAALGVTRSQVQGRRQRLRGTARYELRATPRPRRGRGHWLVAKTCIGCGDLVMRDGYIWRDGHYRERCRRCWTLATRESGDDSMVFISGPNAILHSS